MGASSVNSVLKQQSPLHVCQRLGQWGAALILPLLLASGCKTVSTLDHIQQKKTLTIVTRNSPTTYYESKFGATGFEYALASEFADSLGVRLEIRTAYSLDQLFEILDRNQADIAAAGLTATRERGVDYRFSLPYFEASKLVVYREGTKRPRKIADILDKDIMVLASSSHAELLRNIAADNPSMRWRETAELETLDLLDMVETGELLYTIIDSTEFEVHKAYFPLVRKAFQLSEAEPVSWAMGHKPTDDELYEAVNQFIANISENGTLDTLKERYYGHTTHAGQGDAYTFTRMLERRFPKYEKLIKQVAREEGVDWRLLAAVSYRESHWNPKAVSPTGVKGMMMLTRTTAKEMGVTNRLDVEQSLRGGARYLRKIRRRIPTHIRDPDRTWFALSAYNFGMGHMRDARTLTKQQGGDPDQWADVMQRLPLLQQSKYYKKTRYGYARGSEALTYVQHIRNYYNLLDWQQAGEGRRKPPTQVQAHLPPELRDGSPLTAL
jgi:membrane-bound lytic murein transglycosylase F